MFTLHSLPLYSTIPTSNSQPDRVKINSSQQHLGCKQLCTVIQVHHHFTTGAKQHVRTQQIWSKKSLFYFKCSSCMTNRVLFKRPNVRYLRENAGMKWNKSTYVFMSIKLNGSGLHNFAVTSQLVWEMRLENKDCKNRKVKFPLIIFLLVRQTNVWAQFGLSAI